MMIRMLLICVVTLAVASPPLGAADGQASDDAVTESSELIDLVFVATSPASYTPAQVEEMFRDALETLKTQGTLKVTPEEFAVEQIHSIAEYEALRLIAQDPSAIGTAGNTTPLVYRVEDSVSKLASTWLVHVKDPSLAIKAIEVQYQAPGEEITTGEWEVDTEEAKAAPFRVKSKVSGDYLFTAEPAWKLQRYRIVSGDTRGEWSEWPRDSHRFEIRISGFPANEEAYQKLKSILSSAEGRPNPPRILGEQVGIFSIAQISRLGVGSGEPGGGWGMGGFTITIKAPDAENAWVLFPLTAKQKDSAISALKAMSDLTDKRLVTLLKTGAGTLAEHPIVSEQQKRRLDGNGGPAWYQLDAVKNSDAFAATLPVENAAGWGKTFRPVGKPAEAAYSVYVLTQKGRAVRIGEDVELWGIAPVSEWNGGRPQVK